MNNSTKVTIIFVSIFILIGVYLLINRTINSNYTPAYEKEDFYTIPDRKLAINEYKNVSISNEDMIKKYFNIFISNIFNNREASYNLLDNDYKESKYPTYGMYLNYLNTITDNFTSLPSMSKYRIDEENGKIKYVVIDKKNYEYVFIIEAVMKYKVRFND